MSTKTKNKPAARKRVPSKPALLAVSSVTLQHWPHVLQVEVNGEEMPHRRVPQPTDRQVNEIAAEWSAKGSTVSVRKFNADGTEIAKP